MNLSPSFLLPPLALTNAWIPECQVPPIFGLPCRCLALNRRVEVQRGGESAVAAIHGIWQTGFFSV